LIEYPKILLLNKSEIDRRVEKLRLASRVRRISIGLLKLAAPEKCNWMVKNQVMDYLKPLGGLVNKVDEVVHELNCSDTKAMEILTRNPRLLGKCYRKNIAEKIRCLVRHGARHEDIHQNTNVLNNKTLATIQSRAKRLHSIGWTPLPVRLVGREDAVFDATVTKWETQRSLVTTQCVASCDDVISLLPPMSTRQLSILRPKIEYLLSEGYTVSHIVSNPQTLLRSLKGLQMAVRELRPYHLHCVDLTVINHYALTRRLKLSNRSTFRLVIARVIGCLPSALPPLPEDSSIRAVKDLKHTAVVNAKFLCDELGFTGEDLVSVPLVLAHAPDILRRNWNALNKVVDDQSHCGHQAKVLFRQNSDNRLMQLNLLQYCIEKEVNFSHACVSSWTEDTDDEFGVTESTSSLALVVADDSDTDTGAGELSFYDDDDDDNEDAGELTDRLENVHDSDDDLDPVVV